MALYPLKFKPIVKKKIWGSEVWALSGYGEDESVIDNGYLKDNLLSEAIEVYMDELTGDSVFSRFGNRFPLLFKFINAEDDLSIQVHPTDRQAAQTGGQGKTEMWYVTGADEQASIVLGFDHATSKEAVSQSIQDNTLLDLLHIEKVQTGDVAYIPAGTVHALRRGVKVAEIQQASDTTYRLYDYNRPGLDGKLRPLHIEESLACLCYDKQDRLMMHNTRELGGMVCLVQDEHFTTNLLIYDRPARRDYARLDSFVVYMCIAGEAVIRTEEENTDTHISEGETILIPACMNEVEIIPQGKVKLTETYIEA